MPVKSPELVRASRQDNLSAVRRLVESRAPTWNHRDPKTEIPALFAK
jgi:hypothetical protein